MWLYIQSTGELYRDDGSLCGVGYAGTGIGRNNPALDGVRNVGPAPRGGYTFGEAMPKHPKLGVNVIPMLPDPENEMHGRSHFYMHGDNAKHDASLGCLIQGPAARKEVAASKDRRLFVTDTPPKPKAKPRAT